MNQYGEPWEEAPADPLVRPFFLAGGRARPTRHDLELISLVVATTRDARTELGPEHAEIVRLCQQPQSVAEVSAKIDLPIVVVKVMLSDLIERGYLVFRSPPTTTDIPSPQLLQAVLDGIRRL